MNVVHVQSKEKSSSRGRKRKSPQPKEASPPQDEGGCLKCHKDIDYEQVCTGRRHTNLAFVLDF